MTDEQRAHEHYNRDPARIRSLLGILSALWERHPDRSLMELLTMICGQIPPLTDAELSDRITRRLNAELWEEIQKKET